MGNHSRPASRPQATTGSTGPDSPGPRPRPRPRPAPTAAPAAGEQPPRPVPPVEAEPLRPVSPVAVRPAVPAHPGTPPTRGEPPTPPATPPRGATAVGRHQFSTIADVEATADFALTEIHTVLSVLDVGCGDGSLLSEIATRVPYGQRYVGVDPDPAALVRARRRLDPRLEYLDAEAAGLPFADGSFDLVLALRSVQLWVDRPGALRELARVLTRNGHIVVVDRLAGPVGGNGQASRRLLTEQAAAAGLRVVRHRVLTRRWGVIPRLHGFLLTL